MRGLELQGKGIDNLYMFESFIPHVDIAEGLSSNDLTAAQNLKPILEAAVLDLKGWWPIRAGQQDSNVLVVAGCEALNKTVATSKVARPWTIYVGAHILTQGIGAALSSNPGWTPQQALALVLAHETYHLSEPARMVECKIGTDFMQSPFSRAINPEMDSSWQETIHYLSSLYPYPNSLPATIKKAGDLVTELAADVRALNFAKEKGIHWPTVKDVICRTRKADFISKPSEAYDIANELALINNMPAFPNEREALPIVWEMALQTLLEVDQGNDVNQRIAEGLSALKFEGRLKKLFK